MKNSGWRGWQVAILLLLATAIVSVVVFALFWLLPLTQPALSIPAVQAGAGPSSTPSRIAVTASPSASVTRTPFQPSPNTPTPTASATATPTATYTATITLTPTLTLTPTITNTPTITHTPKPTRKPTATLPSSARVDGVVGHRQISTLDCESRSAVDLAAFWGVSIDEREFIEGLPRSDDPEEGFVGSYNDTRGMIPPNSYGVYPPPIAARLRAYGLNAEERKGMGWRRLRAEIKAGRPVIAWVIGNVWPGQAVSYTAQNGNTVPVAAFEHTVIVVAYDEDTVTVVDENQVYTRTVREFLDSWAVLENRAVTVSN